MNLSGNTAGTASAPLSRERNLLLGALLLLAAGAWVLVIWQARDADDEMMSLTMGMSAPLFLGVWVLMMVAMMFPTAAPMILTFSAIQAGKRGRGQTWTPTWIFVAAYLVVWTLFGVLAYLAAVGAQRLADESMWLMDHAAEIGGVVLILAGLYQLTPLKRACLTRCRTPLQFIMTSWRDGHTGAFQMGLHHGLYCLGCCWFLFVILFPLGIMNVAVMALVTALIFAEKAWSRGHTLSWVAAAVLVGYGLLVMLDVVNLPGMM
jgi:predicted metal-binding membrane protein